MPYTVKQDGATVLKALSTSEDKDGKTVYDNESVLYAAGDVIPDEDVHPVVVEKYDEGDEHTLSLLERTGAKSAPAEPVEEEETVPEADEDDVIDELDDDDEEDDDAS